MKIGLIARTEDRGLGNLTWEWAQHIRPYRVLVVVPNHAIIQRLDRYAEFDPLVQPWDHHRDSTLDERATRAWLDGLDVVYSAETFYDWRVCDWARDAGVRTVCHAMPEYYRHGQPDAPPGPDVWWTPTRWRLDTLPAGTSVVPVPVATERFGEPSPRDPDRPMRWLHVAGARAAADRNGTKLVLAALRALKGQHHVRFFTQDGRLPLPLRPKNVTIEVQPATAEYWQMYGHADAMILPRRYAGLSLPAQESMAAGLALVMTNVEPQASEWPIVPIPTTTRGHVRTAAGQIPLAECTPKAIAAVMDHLASLEDDLALARYRASDWAEDHSWARLESTIRYHLTCVHTS